MVLNVAAPVIHATFMKIFLESVTKCVESGWMYNWDSTVDGLIPTLEYVPRYKSPLETKHVLALKDSHKTCN